MVYKQMEYYTNKIANAIGHSSYRETNFVVVQQ